MNIVYMGTPDFAVPPLIELNKMHNITAVFTQPDKPKGRKMILTPPDVKICAQKLGITVYQPNSFKDEKAVETVKNLMPDVIVVAAYGKILPKAVLEIPKYGCVNIHGSLLPKYRGSAPIQQSVLNGDKFTGVTTMLMDVGIDTGDILMTEKTEIGKNVTSGELFDRLALIGADLVVKTLYALENNGITPKKQDEALASHTGKIDKSYCPIDFSKSADEVHNQIRGLNPWPVATAEFNGKRLKIYSSCVCSLCGQPGTVLCTNPLVVACQNGSIQIDELQPDGKKRMSAQAFAAGHKIAAGDKFN